VDIHATAKGLNIMRAEAIASLAVVDGHLLYKPTDRFIALGMVETDLGEDSPAARAKVVHLNYDARMLKKRAKEQRTLEKADRIRAEQAASIPGSTLCN
jgi:hypothetical protein